MARSKYSLLKKKSFRVKRGERQDIDPITGYPIDSTVIYFEVEGHQYPLDDYRQTLLPEALRNRGARRLHVPATQPSLRTVETSQGKSPDFVEVSGVWYQVQNKECFDMGVLDHTEYLLIKQEESVGEA